MEAAEKAAEEAEAEAAAEQQAAVEAEVEQFVAEEEWPRKRPSSPKRERPKPRRPRRRPWKPNRKSRSSTPTPSLPSSPHPPSTAFWTTPRTFRSERDFPWEDLGPFWGCRPALMRTSVRYACKTASFACGTRRPHSSNTVESYGDERKSRDRARGRPRPAPEPRCRGVRSRRDDALARRDRVGERDPHERRARVLPREPREDLPRGARALREGRARRRDHPRRRARRAQRARERRRQVPDPRAGLARTRDRERPPLRANRPRDRDAPRADPGRRRHRAARLGPPGRDDGARRQGRADRLRPLAAARPRRVQPHRGAPEGELRAHHRALRVGRRRHRRPVGLPRHRPHHVGLPGREPHHRRRAAEHGEVGARALHGREPRRAQGRARRALHARDVEVGGDAAPHVQRGQGRVAAPPHRQARGRRLAAPDRGLRQAGQGAHLRGRHGLDHDDGDPLEGAAPEAEAPRPRAHHRRLPAAHDLRGRTRRTACRRCPRSRAR